MCFLLFLAVQQQGLVSLDEGKTMDRASKLLCCLVLRGWGRPPQLPWSVRSVWKHTQADFGNTLVLYFCLYSLCIHPLEHIILKCCCTHYSEPGQMMSWTWTFYFDLTVLISLFCVCVSACRSWASATWRWTPAVLAAKTAWRKSLQSRSTTPASRTSTKVNSFSLYVPLHLWTYNRLYIINMHTHKNEKLCFWNTMRTCFTNTNSAGSKCENGTCTLMLNDLIINLKWRKRFKMCQL